MKMLKLFTIAVLVALVAGGAQAGVLTPGLQDQIRDMSDDEMIKVLVVMADQADIKSLDWQLHHAKATLAERHEIVLDTLQGQAKTSQADLLADLDAAKAGGGVAGYTSHWLVNGIVVKATVAAVRDLAARPDVERVEADLQVELIQPIPSQKELPADKADRGIGMTPGVQALNAPQVWDELGIDGTGVIVGVLDTGVDGSHPALASRWQGLFTTPAESWLDAAGLGDTDFPVDQHYHGTHVMGTITGLAADDTIGVAPGAHWIATNVINMSSGTAFDNAVITSLEFMADPDGDPLTTDDLPAVVQNSWGVNEGFTGYYDCDSRWWDAIDNCEAAGVCLTWSAGNEGSGSGTLRSPADRAASPTNCFSVGSTIATAPYTISDFSSRGPSGCGGEFAMKPEVCAPGSDIYSAEPGGGYQYLSGTSMAGPHVAGVVALMRASNPNVDVITVKEVLMATAVDLGDAGEDNTYGHGFVDAYQAVLAVMGGIGSIDGTITDSVTGLPIAGAVVNKVDGYNTDTTDAAGSYSMTLPIGQTDFTVTAFGYADGAFSVEILEDQTVTVNVTLVPLPTSTLSGIVYGPEGQLVENATVSAVGTPVAPATTDVFGYYELVLPSGSGVTYTVRAGGGGAGMGADQATIELTGDLTHDFNLPLQYAEDFESGTFVMYPWEMSGTADWTLVTDTVYEGTYAARSGSITHNQDSVMELEIDVAVEGDISFFYSVSSESGWDYLRFYVDGVQAGEWSGTVAWTEFTHTLTAGTHTVTWAYEKDVSQDVGSDCAWVDYIVFPTIVPPTFPEIGLDVTGFDVTLAPDGTTVLPLTITNSDEGALEFEISLVETDGATLATETPAVPYRDFGKDEIDDRAPVNPLTGFGGPDVYGYNWIDSDEAGGPVYDWVDISTDGTAITLDDDDNVGPYALGFDMSYYGNTYSELQICSNGWVSFTATTTTYSNQGIPNASDPNNLLAVFWDDLNPEDGGMIYYKSEPENGRFIVMWDAVPHYSYSGDGLPVTFEVILNADGSIVYQYGPMNEVDGATVGIENADGTDGLQVAFDAEYLYEGLAVYFYLPPPLTWVTADPLDGVVAGMGNQPVDVTFDATDLAVGTYYAEMTVVSNDQDESQIALPITLTVTDSTPVLDGLLPRAVEFLGAVPNPFNPATDLKFSIPRQADVTLRLYDVSGRLVRSLVNETLEAGSHEVRWNGRDDSGRAVASGTYFARLSVAGEPSVRPLVLVR